MTVYQDENLKSKCFRISEKRTSTHKRFYKTFKKWTQRKGNKIYRGFKKMNLEQEILIARGKNWARLIVEKQTEFAKQEKNDVGLMLDILNGNVYELAQQEIAVDLATGKLDKMLMPRQEV